MMRRWVASTYQGEVKMEKLESALLAACKAFMIVYQGSQPTPQANAMPAQKTLYKDQEYSNGIPKCPVHDRIMSLRQGPRGDFYGCSAKENDPDLCNRNGYCKYTVNA